MDKAFEEEVRKQMEDALKLGRSGGSGASNPGNKWSKEPQVRLHVLMRVGRDESHVALVRRLLCHS
jgi:hypothetical protein